MGILGAKLLPAALLLSLSAACGPIAASPPAEGSGEPTPSGVASSSPALARPRGPCGRGAVHDDGSVETGYSYVPTAVMGQYVQEFERRELPAKGLEKVCVCWLRTRADDTIDFEVVFYPDQGARPASEPYAVVAATASEVPNGVPAAGRFWEVDVSDVTLADGTSYIGVRWNPSVDRFFFVCTDTSEETERVDVFSMEDRAPRWTNVIDSRDPIFRPHRAILVRAAGTR